MEKVKFEYLLKTHPQILFRHLSTPDGLATWFADDVVVDGDLFVFKWRGYEEAAKLYSNNKKMNVVIDWLDEEKKLEFRISMNSLTNDVVLTVVECRDEDESEEDLQKLWDAQINLLKRRLGAN